MGHKKTINMKRTMNIEYSSLVSIDMSFVREVSDALHSPSDMS